MNWCVHFQLIDIWVRSLHEPVIGMLHWASAHVFSLRSQRMPCDAVITHVALSRVHSAHARAVISHVGFAGTAHLRTGFRHSS
jgi:hypothetical protein